MAKKTKDILFKKSFRVRENQDDYTFKLKRRHNWWWLLLLLLPLLLLINCSHDVVVTVITEDGQPVEGMKVDIDYSSHWLLNKEQSPMFFASSTTKKSNVTNDEGKAVFKNVETSVLGYIFYCLSNETFTFHDTKSVTVKENPLEKNMHFTRNVTVVAQRKRTPIKLQVIDKEDQSPIAGANVTAFWSEGKNKKKASGKSDPNGIVTFNGVWTCAVFDSITSKAYAYNDTTILNMSADSILATGKNIIYMTPVKESFTFFVKDAESKQPIPGAQCKVSIIGKNINKSDTATTNVDGKGKGEYKNAPLTSMIEINPVTAQNYLPGHLELDSALRRVDKFITLSEDQRTIWLEPKANALQFQNVDSISGNGIKGVTNKITITGPVGKSEDTQISNTNGFFNAQAKNGYTIEIISECDGYKQKKTVIKNFDVNNLAKPVKIKLEPILVELTFRTIDAEDKSLVDNCTLTITGSISGKLQPYNSGNGEFTVKNLRLTETISITSAKSSYKTNDKTINNKKVEYLNNPQTPAKERDIPMELNLEPCDMEAFNFEQNGQREQIRQFNTNRLGGVLKFTYNTYDIVPDRIRIYNGTKDDYMKNPNQTPIWQTNGYVLTGSLVSGQCQFKSKVITVVIDTNHPDVSETSCDFIPECPE